MNKVEKELTKAQLKDEERALKELQKTYTQARKDIKEKIAELNSRDDLQNIESIVHQKKYQEMMLKQIDGVLSDIEKGQYKTLTEFMQGSYVNGYIGSMYDLANQGIPLTVPINPEKMQRSITTNSKLQTPYYTLRKTPENVSVLKRRIRTEMTRGIASGKTWIEVANNIANGMNTPFKRALFDAMRIVRTEGHRINQEGFLDASRVAKKKGADVVKQWDSTLDSRTRPAHQEADGQIREIDEKFIVGGEEMDAPSVGGSAFNVCNCRCQMLQRARWMLDQDELDTLRKRADYFGLNKDDSFDEFKSKYLTLPANADNIVIKKLTPVKLKDGTSQLIDELRKQKIVAHKIQKHSITMTEEEIIKSLAGGDRTQGSCASVAMAYMGQKKGLDVLDFRGGKSMEFFSSKMNKKVFFSQFPDIWQCVKAKNTAKAGTEALKLVENGKEYLLGVGRHMSVVRRTEEGVLQYLELQSETLSGWHNFSANPRQTLISRFGCSGKGFKGLEIHEAQLTSIDDFDDTDELQALLEYINTSVGEQKKGVGGSVK